MRLFCWLVDEEPVAAQTPQQEYYDNDSCGDDSTSTSSPFPPPFERVGDVYQIAILRYSSHIVVMFVPNSVVIETRLIVSPALSVSHSPQ